MTPQAIIDNLILRRRCKTKADVVTIDKARSCARDQCNVDVEHLIIDGVSSQIDANSLQVKATGNVIILDSKFGIFYPKPETPKLDGLPLKIRKQIYNLE